MTTTDNPSVATPADWVNPSKQGKWTYEDYLSLPDNGNHYEIVNGVLYMAPSPTGEHQDAVGRIYHYLLMNVEFAALGKVRFAPFDVRLSSTTVVQPDVLIVLNAHKDRIQRRYIQGAPDLVVEIASPSTASLDRREKQDAYARAGVPEYWLVDADAHTVELLTLEGSVYRSLGVFEGEDTLPSKIVPVLPVQVQLFFA